MFDFLKPTSSKRGKYKVFSVANYIAEQWSKTNADEKISILALLKYAFFCYGWYLATKNERLFDATIKTFPLGPVITEIYRGYDINYRDDYYIKKYHKDGNSSDLVAEDKAFIDVIIARYAGVRPWELSDLTHFEGSPWTLTVNRIGTYKIIEDQLILEYYKGLERKKIIG